VTAVAVTPMEPGHFGVQIDEGGTEVSTRVRITEGFVADLDLTDVEEVTIVEEALLFLLDRLEAPSIPSELSLDSIASSYPDFYDELRSRLTVP
jgi:hypothetical protein